MALNALFVCHAGAGLGLGHLTRSLVAAKSVREQLGFDVSFLIQGDCVDRPDLKQYPHCFLPLQSDLVGAVRQKVAERSVGLVVFDIHPNLVPGAMRTLLYELRAMGCKVVAVDALASFSPLLDLLFIPSFRFSIPFGADASKFRYGWDCYLLNSMEYGLWSWSPGSNVLVLTGGSDATGLGRTLPSMLDAAFAGDKIFHWVVGPYADDPLLPKHPQNTFKLHKGLADLGRLMHEVNYAVTVFGVSFFELLSCGVPTVVFSPYGTKYNTELEALDSERVALVAQDEGHAVKRMGRLMADDELAKDLSVCAKEKVPCNGGQTFVEAVTRVL